jgi:hypothetical protein
MPAYPRQKNKATKIAWKILGTPENLTYKEKGKLKEISEKVFRENTFRVK